MISRLTIQSGRCLFVALALTAGQTLAQPPTTRPVSPMAAIPRVPEYTATARVPERLLNNRANQAIVLPSEPGEYGEEPSRLSAGALANPTPTLRPLPDGYVIGRRPGRVEQQGSNYVVHLEQIARLPDAGPLQVLPNTRLALLESVLAEGSQDRRFLITGRITEFQGTNYILIDDLAELIERKDEIPPPAAAQPSEPAGTTSTRPAGQTEIRPPGREQTAEELIHQLMRDRPARPVVLPDEVRVPATTPSGPSERPLAGQPDTERARWPDETLLSDRNARLVPGERGTGWMLAFEDPGKKPVDRPIRVLPSRLLETALNLTAGGARPAVLIVSGEVTAYRGANYLLLRKVLVRRDMGNLR